MRRKRSPAEIGFRLGQEFHNLRLYAFPPSPVLRASRIAALPPPPNLNETPFAAEVIRLADLVLSGHYPLLGRSFQLGIDPDWHSDFISGRAAPLKYFRLVPYLDFQIVGDHKTVWELNRHQWLVVLAMAYRFTSDDKYTSAIHRHLERWIASNPFQQGINWCSALEVAFRALSWIWIHHLAGLDEKELSALYRHGLHLERNLSFYFSPNTHLLGEALALYALGRGFPEWPRAVQWSQTGGKVVHDQLDRQIRPDGSHFEQSSYYHVYALDMFLFYRVLGGAVPDDRLVAMANYLDTLLGSSGAIPLIGDDDGGRFFHPYGKRTRFGRASLATCSALLKDQGWTFSAEDRHEQADWWLGSTTKPVPSIGQIQPRRSTVFRDSGLVSLVQGSIEVLFDAGSFGEGSGGHSHSDALSILARCGDQEILVDSGTFTYVADPVARELFRGTAAHNSIRVDNREQAVPSGPFRWIEKPTVELVEASETAAEAVCRTVHYTHRRRIELKGYSLHVQDDVDRGALVEVFWHVSNESDLSRIHAEGATIEIAPRSDTYGQKYDGPVVRIARHGAPVTVHTVIDLRAQDGGARNSHPHETGSSKRV